MLMDAGISTNKLSDNTSDECSQHPQVVGEPGRKMSRVRLLALHDVNNSAFDPGSLAP